MGDVQFITHAQAAINIAQQYGYESEEFDNYLWQNGDDDHAVEAFGDVNDEVYFTDGSLLLIRKDKTLYVG